MNTKRVLKVGCSKCKVLYSLPLPEPNGPRVPHTIVSSHFVVKRETNEIICYSCYYGISMENLIENESK